MFPSNRTTGVTGVKVDVYLDEQWSKEAIERKVAAVGKNYWLLKHHQFFLDVHALNHPELNTDGLETFREHPYFDYTTDWVRRYDQNSIQSQYDSAPLEFFVPMVKRLFSRPTKGKILNS